MSKEQGLGTEGTPVLRAGVKREVAWEEKENTAGLRWGVRAGRDRRSWRAGLGWPNHPNRICDFFHGALGRPWRPWKAGGVHFRETTLATGEG